MLVTFLLVLIVVLNFFSRRERFSAALPLPTRPRLVVLGYGLFSCGHATLHLAVSVGRSVGHIFEFRAFFALPLLPNRPRLDCRVSGLVSYCCCCCSLQSCNIRKSERDDRYLIIPELRAIFGHSSDICEKDIDDFTQSVRGTKVYIH